MRGIAQARPYPIGGGPSHGGNWWYAPSYGGYYGGYYGSYYGRYGYYNGYGPWGYYGYPGSRYYWGVYVGDPFLYDPFGYYGYGITYPYYWGMSVGYTGGGGSEEPRERTVTGSIRLKVSPKHARVYIDGALAGTADDFDGLSDHLKLAPGPHELELRADGYARYTGQIQVQRDRTTTERVTLKKQ